MLDFRDLTYMFISHNFVIKSKIWVRFLFFMLLCYALVLTAAVDEIAKKPGQKSESHSVYIFRGAELEKKFQPPIFDLLIHLYTKTIVFT